MFELDYIKKDLWGLTPDEIYEKYMRGDQVWYFENHVKEDCYQEFKQYISQKLNIAIENIGIVGSAKTGYSFTPANNLRAFVVNKDLSTKESDIDLVLVSDELFNKFWFEYLRYNVENYLDNYRSISSEVFRKFVTINPSIKGNKVFVDWNKKIDGLKKDLQLHFGIEHTINYRIYQNWQAVKWYHLKGIKELKKIFYE